MKALRLYLTVICGVSALLTSCDSRKQIESDLVLVRNAWIVTTNFVYDGEVSSLALSACRLDKNINEEMLKKYYNEGASVYGKVYLLSLISKHDKEFLKNQREEFEEFLNEELVFLKYGVKSTILLKDLLDQVESGEFYEKCVDLSDVETEGLKIAPVYAGFVEE